MDLIQGHRLSSRTPSQLIMAPASIEPFLKGDTGRNTRGLLRLIILCTIAGAAVASRLFSVISKTLQRPYVMQS